MKFFRKSKNKVIIPKLRENFPNDLQNYILDNYFFPILRKQFNATDDWKGNDTSIVRLKVGGELCTRVVLLNNGGGAEEALDFCGQIGDLLWLICNKE